MAKIRDKRSYGEFVTIDGKVYWKCGYCGKLHTSEVRRGYHGTKYPNMPSKCKRCWKSTVKWLEWHKEFYKARKIRLADKSEIAGTMRGLFTKR